MDEELIKNKFLLFVGTYSKRVKIFEIISENSNGENKENKINDNVDSNKKDKIEFCDLGNLIVDNSGSINQIEFYNGYLFVACDRKILYIYSV